MNDINFICLTGSVRSPAVISPDGSICQVAILHEQGSVHQEIVAIGTDPEVQKILTSVTEDTVGFRVAVSGEILLGVPASDGIYVKCKTFQFIDAPPEQTGITFEDD